MPRRPVVLYAQLAMISLWYTRAQVDKYGEPEASFLPNEIAFTVREAAEMISRAAWASPATRWIWLPLRQRHIARQLRAIEDDELVPLIAAAPKFVR